jgi:hypothetical protein
MHGDTDKLLQELSGGTGCAPATAAARPPDAQDRLRILLVEIVYLLNACYRDVQYWEGVKAEKDTFRLLARALQQLPQSPGQERVVRIARKAAAAGRGHERPDYEVRFAEVSADTVSVGAVIKRTGIRLKHLEGRVQKSFETFAAEGIDTLELALPDDSPESLERLQGALRVLSCFRQAVEKGTPIRFSRGGEHVSVNPVRDDKGRPDLGLTLLAATNQLPAEAMEDIVRKVSAFMQRPEGAALRQRFATVYQALFAVRSLRERLQKPPLEVNAALPPAAPPAQDGAAVAQAAGDAPPAGAASTGGSLEAPAPAAVMAEPAFMHGMARLVENAFGNAPAAASQAMRCLDGREYARLDATHLGERLALLTRLLNAMQTDASGRQLLEAALQRIQEGMNRLPAELLNDVIVQDNVVKVWKDGGESVVGSVETQLAQTIETAKDHAAGRRRKRPVEGTEPLFFSKDTAALAAHFDLPPDEMEAILTLFRGCFDGRGNFQKVGFERRIPEFARHHRKILRVLWEFLRDMPRRSDRVPFLNSLQLLVRDIRQPLQAVGVLLSDFLGEPAQVDYADRNAVMLSIQFLRTYNKEKNIDIELTPEEILQVRTGLDARVVSYAGWKINGERKRVLTKAVSVRKRLREGFEPEAGLAPPMPARFLLALERELHIFLALVGGDTASAVLNSALNVYGDPGAPFYATQESRQHLYALLQHQSVLIRAVGRVGSEIDLGLLERVRRNEKAFIEMSADPRHTAMARRVFSWIEPARRDIESRRSGGPPPSHRPAERSPGLSSTNTLDL